MDIRSDLMDLEISARRISDGLDAIQMMVIGLDGAGSGYAGALHAIWDYLSDASRELQAQLAVCLSAV